jgi:hypothetical protein
LLNEKKKVLGNVKFKIENCGKTYNNFSLLYLKAKLTLVKRLVDTRMPPRNVPAISGSSSHVPSSGVVTMTTSAAAATAIPTQTSTTPKTKKKFNVDRILNIFFKSNSNDNLNLMSPSFSGNSHQTNPVNLAATAAERSTMAKSNIGQLTMATHAANSNSNDQQELFTPNVEIDLNDIKMK